MPSVPSVGLTLTVSRAGAAVNVWAGMARVRRETVLAASTACAAVRAVVVPAMVGPASSREPGTCSKRATVNEVASAAAAPLFETCTTRADALVTSKS